MRARYALWSETGKPIPEVAEELGVHSGTLHSWVSRWRRNESASSDRPAEPAPGGRMREAERAELDRLRREMTEKNKQIRHSGQVDTAASG
ncbi:transposase [Streptomyces celluloflavus]|uniref:transposase n=1 Tax=Streptomyces celluloflavus TaxID=58344 RepID=UPI00368C02D2